MRAWTVKFNGHHPVGACAVVVAPDLIYAAELMSKKLVDMGLGQPLPLSNFEEIFFATTSVKILLDGNY